jgi:hypothetical protein
MHADPRYAPIDLWRIMAEYLRILYNLFGDSSRLAIDRIMSPAAYKIFMPWLRAGECLLRRLLLAEAAAMPRPALKPSPPRARARPRAKAPPPPFAADQPDNWKLSFRCFEAKRAGKRARAASKRVAPRGFYPARALALRYEALLRVYNNPHRTARRLARRLYAKPALLKRMLNIPDNAENLVGPEDFAAIDAAAQQGARLLDSS